VVFPATLNQRVSAGTPYLDLTSGDSYWRQPLCHCRAAIYSCPYRQSPGSSVLVLASSPGIAKRSKMHLGMWCYPLDSCLRFLEERLCRRFLYAALPLFVVGMVSVIAQSAGGAASTEILKDLTPGGKLRAAINLGNSVLAQTDVASGQPKGITPDLARELGHRLGVPVEFVIFDAAGKVFEAARSGVWDIAFVAIDPVRAAEIEFTAPYVLIEGTYMVPADSPLKTISDVDRPGVRVAVGLGSAYDLYLTRTIKYATIVRATAGGGHEMLLKTSSRPRPACANRWSPTRQPIRACG